MRTTVALLALALFVLEGANGFFQSPPVHRVSQRRAVTMMGGRKATPLGRTSTPAGKEARVQGVKELLEGKILLFSVPSAGLSMKQLSNLREKMPDTTQVMVVKNTLMDRACSETDWSSISELLTRENMWFFVGEEIRETVDGYEKWLKEENIKEGFDIKAGVTEGGNLTPDGVKAMSKLPTKLELIARIASSLKQAGAQGIVDKLANVKGGPKSVAVRLNKASGQKLATAVKMALTDPEKNPNA